MSNTTIQKLMQRKADLVAEMRSIGVEALKDVFREFFNKHPECLAVRWSQYTPYFNDGSACEFSRGDMRVRLTDSREDAGDYEDGFEHLWSGDKRPPRNAVFASVKDIEKIDDDIFEFAFGDHVQVTATPDGFEVEEYSHD